MTTLKTAALILILLHSTVSLKVLVFSPIYATSHTNFMARIADTLTDAGHQVTFFTPIEDESIRDKLGVRFTKDVVVLEQDEIMKRESESESPRDTSIFWTLDLTSANNHLILETRLRQAEQTCGNLFRNREVLEQLRPRQFDVAIAEPLMVRGLALFRHLGIEKVIVSSSCTNYDIMIPSIGDPEELSYVPSMNSQVTDNMSFADRLENYQLYHVMIDAFHRLFDGEMAVYRSYLGHDIAHWKDLIQEASLHFTNSIPFIDFPRPTLQKTIPIGGITVDIEQLKAQQVTPHFDEILKRRSKTMLISFGTMMSSSQMPLEFKTNVVEVMRSEPNVTFIWKYEDEDVGFARGVHNVVFEKWVPQSALLNDPRLTAFLTHGGLGSTNELCHLGKPAVMIPIFADQHRNSHMLARHHMAVVLHKRELGKYNLLQGAVHEILHNSEYAENARRVAEMLQKRPDKPKETLVRYVEFVGRFGPLHKMSPHSLQLSWIVRHNYDLYLYKLLSWALPLFLAFCAAFYLKNRFVCLS